MRDKSAKIESFFECIFNKSEKDEQGLVFDDQAKHLQNQYYNRFNI